RRPTEERSESFAHETDRALRLLYRSFGVNTRRALQIGFRLSDYARNRFHALAHARNPFFRRCEISSDHEVKAVRKALHVNERIPVWLLQLFSLEDLVIYVLLQNAKIDVVRA